MFDLIVMASFLGFASGHPWHGSVSLEQLSSKMMVEKDDSLAFAFEG